MSVLASSSSSSVALITGGAAGIGKAIAKKLASQKIKVVTADILPAGSYHNNSIPKVCDITKGKEIDALFEWMNNNTGLPDILVLNAGRGIHEQLTEGDPEKWQKVLDLNVMGLLRCIRAFVPPMKEKKRGEVVVISSVAASKPYAYGGIYSASKAAVEIIAETLRLETLPDIRVTVVAAGVVDTGFFENEISGHKSVENIGMGSLSAEDVAEDVWYAINKKKGTGINKIITRPAGQDF